LRAEEKGNRVEIYNPENDRFSGIFVRSERSKKMESGRTPVGWSPER